MNDCTLQGVDIHLKIFQTLLSLVTNFPTIHCRLLANVRTFILCSLFSSLTDGLALLARFRLREPGMAVVSFTATATLGQLVMFIVDKVVEEDCCRMNSDR
jgi:hypothetical protein